MRPFEPKNKKRRTTEKPFVQKQLRIEVDDLYIPEIQPLKEKEEERRGVAIIDVF